jgi:hypothetical protein
MALYVVSAPKPHAESSDAVELRSKIRQLDQRGQRRALAILNGFADQFFGNVVTESPAEVRARTIARLRACGAEMTAAYLERQGTHG